MTDIFKAERYRIRQEEEAKARAKVDAERRVAHIAAIAEQRKNNPASEAVTPDGAQPALVQTEPAAPVARIVAIDANRSDAQDAARYRWLRSRLLGADFDWNGSGTTVLAFAFPRDVGIGGDCTTANGTPTAT